MPQVTKQSAKTITKPPTRNSKPGNLLDRITPVNQVDSGGIKVSLYGRPKSGKTRLISTFPKPVLIVGAEDGTRSVRNVKDVFFVRVILEDAKKPEDGSFIYLHELGELIDSVAEGGYQTVAIDTASALQDLILCDILGLKELPAQKTWGLATRDQYGQCGLKLKTVLRRVLELPMNVVVTAHERNFNEEADSDLILPSIGSALAPSVAGWLNGAAEYICQTYIREGVQDKKTKVGEKEVVTRQKTGKAEYCLRVGPHPVFMTGFRLPPGQELPEMIVDPSYAKIAKLVYGE